MDIGSLMRIGLTAGIEKALLAGEGLKPGDQLRVAVIEVLDNGRALLDFGRFRALAEISFPVQAGDELTVRVLATEGQLHLRRVTPEVEEVTAVERSAPRRPADGEALNRLRFELARFLESLPRTQPAARQLPAELAQRLAQLLADLSPLRPESGPAQAASAVYGLCQDSGVFFEKRVEDALARLKPDAPGPDLKADPGAAQPAIQRILASDLKPRLAAVQHLLASRTPDHPLLQTQEAAALSRCVSEMLAEISHQQEQIVARREDPDPFQVIHFCLPLREGRNKARLKIGYPKKRAGRGRPPGHRAALLLDLDRLGPTRVDLATFRRSLTVAFFVAEAAARRLIQSHCTEIQAVLEPLFEDVKVTVAVSAKRITAFETEELQPAGRRRLDVRA